MHFTGATGVLIMEEKLLEIPPQEEIEKLEVNEVLIMKRIAEELNIRIPQVSAVVSLVEEGCTIPFIARYRKERHDNLNEVQVRDVDHLYTSYKNLETRRIEIIKAIFKTGKLTQSLYTAIITSTTLTELEDLYAPFKKKKKTRGMIAIEKGLAALADSMMTMNDSEIEEEAKKYIKTDNEDKALNVETVSDALNGAKDIIAERVSQNTDNRVLIRDLYMAHGKIITKGIVPEGKTDEDVQKSSNYKMYWDYSESLNQIKPHRILAINRAERDGELSVTIDVDTEEAIKSLQSRTETHNKYHTDAIAEGVERLLSPAVIREIRSNEADEADEHGIGIFSENLKNLLMTQPIKRSRVLGVDPGIRTGTKCAALDETGKYLGYFKIFQLQNPEESYKQLNDAIDKYDIKIVAVGNGTGSADVQALVSKVIDENYKDSGVCYTVVDESGASVYSASDVATKEFPDLDLTIRGAISMGRRLQDPLAELVKIDPKSIGVGLYQHDVNQKKLSDTLDEVVESVVNKVGVNLNTASYMLLKYVSGITMVTAKKITTYRDKNGIIKSREELKSVPGLGPKTFEQCAGFLKVAESSDPLDNTWVHPENYNVAREVYDIVKNGDDITKNKKSELCKKYNIGQVTLDDIISELKKPNLDPRDDYPAPIMQKGVVNFEDLKIGMKVTGKIRNVVDFGAFVDIGLHETALIHISQLSDNFVADPMDIVKVGDTKEFTIIDLDPDRKRISLSLKSNPLSQNASVKTNEHATLKEHASVKKDSTTNTQKKFVIAVKKGDASKKPVANNFHKNNNGNFHKQNTLKDSSHYNGSSDGLRYNPFAMLLKK